MTDQFLNKTGLARFWAKIKEYHISNTDVHISAQERTKWNNKVDSIPGKGLSTNDYTNEEKIKLANAPTTEDVTALSNEDDLLQAQIDQLVAPTGEAPSAAEVENARVGADATVYPTLGEAVRGQVTDLKSALNIVNDSLDFMAMETYVPEYSIALGNTNAKTLAESVYLQPGNYILTYTQEQTLTSNIRNTPWYAPMGGTKQYQSPSTNNNLSSGVYNWNITIASAGNYDFGLWVNTPSSAVDFKDFYLHKTDTKTEVARIKGDISTLDEYTKGIYQSIVITGNASTNIIKPFYVKAGDVITVYNNGTAITSAYTCSEDGTTIETISSSIGANYGKASITATHNTNYIKLWSSAILNVRCENEDSVINSLKDKDEALDGVAKLVTNDVTVNELKSGNLYYRYAFKAGYKYRVTNNSETTCSLATCNASNTVIDLVSTGLPYGKYGEFVATGDAVSLRIWSSVSEKKVTIESYNTLLYYNNHGISGPYVPEYYMTYLPDKLETIRSLGETVCLNGEQFIFLTDYHDYKNAKQSPALVKYLFENTGVKFIVFGGDNINLGHGYNDVFNEIAQFFGDFNFLDRNQMIVVTGNHEFFSNLTSGHEESEIPTKAVLYYSLMNQRSLWTVSTDEYGDFILANPLSKIYYCVYSCDYEALITDAQVNAVADMVMELNNGWHIMFIAHRLLMGDASVIANTSVTGLADAIAAQSSVTINGVTHNFSTKDIDVLPLLSGHTHQDGMVRTTGGLPVIGTTTDAIELDLINTRTKGTVDEQAFDVVSLDMTNRIIYLTRIGAGSDRQYSY